MSLLNKLAEIREMQGKSPLPDPSFIQGFDSQSIPKVEFDPDVPKEWLAPELDQMPAAPEPPPSLIPPRRPKAEPPTGSATAAGGPFKLVVADRAAAWKGRGVDLTQQEEGAIRRVVLQAIQRELDADLAAVTAPRRPRKPRTTQTPTDGTGAPSEAPRKRGRPRKVQP